MISFTALLVMLVQYMLTYGDRLHNNLLSANEKKIPWNVSALMVKYL